MSDPDARLVHALKQLGAEHEPPPGWQARVLAAIEPAPQRRPAPQKRPRWWWFAIPAAAAAAGAVLLWAWPPPEPLTLVVARDPSAPPVRASGAYYVVGDPIRVVVRGGERHRAIWVYREGGDQSDGDALVAACPGSATCRSSDGTLALALTLEHSGTYRVMAWTSSDDLPAPGGEYEDDVAAATQTGATRKEQEIRVH